MGIFVLQETPVGYALFKTRKSKKDKKNGLAIEDDTPEGIAEQFKLKEFQKFDSAATALEQAAALVEGKVTPRLSSLLDSIQDEAKATLAVADPKLIPAINKLPQLDLKLINDSTTLDMYRAIRNHLPSLIPGLQSSDIQTMSLGLSHSLSRHKLKFSTDKVDTMIVQAISLLDDLDKELNIYAMRVKEWYGWHFPEMAKIVNDNLAYSRLILKMGMRTSAATTDLAEILPEEIETAVKSAAEVSMGTEITEEDLENIQALAEQVVSFSEYRIQLSSYLSSRMQAIAPNLTALVGDLVGARLIAHSGTLMNLAKSPASTIQILGAEKALFRALKTKHDTPKYGLIYHSSLIGQATGKNKGKIARLLATKAALGLRVDALADWGHDENGKESTVTEEERSALGVSTRQKIERRLAALEGKPIRPKGVAIAPNGISHQPGKWEVKEARKYNPDADGLAGDEPAAKKSKKDKSSKLIEELPNDSDVKGANGLENGVVTDEESEDEDEEISEAEAEAIDPELKNGAQKAVDDDDRSETIGTVSDDTPDSPASPTQQEMNWQSPIEGNTKAAKKARKKERHARKVILSDERSEKRKYQREKIARKLERSERRQKRLEQLDRRAGGEEHQLQKMAELAGLPLSRYKRKLERGEIEFDADGKPHSISKKDIKKAKKAAAAADGESTPKRKRTEEDEEALEKAERKRRKKEAKKAATAGL